MSAWTCRQLSERSPKRSFHLVFESHDGTAYVPIPERSTSLRVTSTPPVVDSQKRLTPNGRLEKRTLVERSGLSVNASPLERGLPGSHRVDDHADGLDHYWGVVDHDVVSRVRVGDVHRAGHERRELVLGPRVRSVDDRSEVRRRVRRQVTGLDELRDDIDELVA